ncbi:hypothetical protein ABZ413_17965 [Nocardia rhamnosiphila]|uniref:hypothetical protein n=1 Tax=Nocardia rhamnosiphila TaxID=426716 RepID=UPI0033F83C33
MTKPQYPVPYPQPPRKSRTALWIALGVLGFFVLLCGGCAGIIADDTDNPSSTTQQHLPHLSQHRLPVVSSALDVRLTTHHQAGADAAAAADIALAIADRIGAHDLETLAKATGTRLGRLSPAGIAACR